MTSETSTGQLRNGLSSDFENWHISQKTSREYILLGTFERKTAFSVIYSGRRKYNPFFKKVCTFVEKYLGTQAW